MPNPPEAALEVLTADAANLPANTTYSTAFPASAISKPHIQFAWDGSPSDADNREDAVVRITVWTPKGQPSLAQTIAGGIRARLLAWSSDEVWRVDRGAGRLPGVDGTTGLPFCTFTVSFVMHALTP